LNFDVNRVFNISHNENVNGVEVLEQHIGGDVYLKKYVQKLEEEVRELRTELRKQA
jgi:hypothetical protein